MLTAIIIDDKPLAIDILVSYIQKMNSPELKATFTNPLEGLAYIQSNRIDLVFLDIQMPELTGIQFMQMAESKTHFILTTAYTNYAVEGFEHSAIDYLVKPISFERFYLSVQKAKQVIENSYAARSLESTLIKQKDYVFIKTDKKLKKLYFKDILYMEARQNYVEFITETENCMALQTMKQTEEMLPAGLFCRVHKSYIINISAIESVEQHIIQTKNKSIPVGEVYRDGFYKKLGI